MAEKTKTKFLGRVPIDPNLVICTSDGESYINKFNNSPVSQVYRSIVQKIISSDNDESMDIEH